MNNVTFETAAHVVQLSLAPVFLLSGIAALLNVFATRLGRVADQATVLGGQPRERPGRDVRLKVLHWRSRALDWAVLLAAMAGVLTCATVLVLFLGAALNKGAASLLFLLFGAAIVFTMGALVAFVIEMLLAARDVRQRVADTARLGS